MNNLSSMSIKGFPALHEKLEPSLRETCPRGNHQLRFAACLIAMLCVNVGGCGPDRSGQYVPPAKPAGGAEEGPTIEKFSVWRPFFFTAYGNHAVDEIVGTAFAIRTPKADQTYLLTAHHLLGPKTGLSQVIKPQTADQWVNRIIVSEAFGASDSPFDAGMPINALSDDATEDAGDERTILLLAAGPVGSRLKPFSFSDAKVAVGDEVFLVTAVFTGESPSKRTHRAIVKAVHDDGTFECMFDNEKLGLDGADGAPLIDAEGRVIGMNLEPLIRSSGVESRGILSTVILKEIEQRLVSAKSRP